MDTTYAKTKVDSTTIKISVQAKPQTTAQKIWNNFLAVNASQKARAQKGAKDKWGVAPMDWYIYRKATMEQYAPIYEYIYNSSQIHSISPEFMHSVTMGEGLHLLLEDLRSTSAPYEPLFVIDAYAYLGADEIGSNIDKLIKDGYIDAKHKNNIVPNNVVNELNQPKVSALVSGYETGIEIIAAELHSRRDWITDYVVKNALTVDTSDSDAVDFLTYATYNNMKVGVEAAKNIKDYMRKFAGSERSDQSNVRFNTLKRLATSDWYKNAKVYEI